MQHLAMAASDNRLMHDEMTVGFRRLLDWKIVNGSRVDDIQLSYQHLVHWNRERSWCVAIWIFPRLF